MHPSARQDHVSSARVPDDAGEAVGAAGAGDDAESGFGKADLGGAREHAEGGGEG